ncbi:MAG: hypoxanthine phosphoribosyltransferase [Bacteroidia bacterium]|nr:hypoxanthine phosphoribosyltransferase [Bacteroidia bacterium]
MNEKIKILDKYFKPYIPHAKIENAVNQMASKINADFQDKNPLCVSILNGSFMFASDILKKFKFPLQLEFLKLSSYSGTVQEKEVKQLIGMHSPERNRHILILEDIVDTGNTLEKIIQSLQEFEPLDIKIATLFFKPGCYKKSYSIDYVGLEIGNEFIVGYGLDYNGYGRNLADIYVVCE